MVLPVTMPELGESVTEGIVTRWLKDVGDTVEVDEPLLEVSTDKVDTEIPSPAAGTLLEQLVAEDQTAQVGAVLAQLGEPGEMSPGSSPTDGAAASETAPASAEQGSDATLDDPPETPPAPAADARSAAKSEPSPAVEEPTARARPSAKEPLPGPAAGATSAAATSPRPSAAPAENPPRSAPAPQRSSSGPAAGTTVAMPRLRQIIARRMADSLLTSAQLTTVQEVDVTRIAQLRTAAKADFERREGVKLTFLPFFAKAAVEALKAFPVVNASIAEDGKSIVYHQDVHLGIAVDTPKGLMVPVIRNAQELSLAGLARKIADVAARTRNNSIKPDELSGGTFTITNIGSVGAEFDTPIINQPQVAILATGAIVRRPAVVTGPDGDEQTGIRSQCFLPLTYDHRLIDGADAGRFVSTIRARLETAAFAAELGH
jgi:2-oxoglutarate dehydrogenase E2 component (dihydrolipoamide succinyltransferase)